MKNEIKVLKQIKKYREKHKDRCQSAEEICMDLKLDYDKTIAVFRHLENQGFVVAINRPNFAGQPEIDHDLVGITTNGIIHLERRIPKKIRFYAPLVISSIAVIISIIALFKK